MRQIRTVIIPIGEKLDHIPIVTADTEDYESIKRMAAKTKVLLNNCGPFRLIGEPVVKACIESGTHHLDISGETEYMENMELKYHEEAMKKGKF